MTDYSAWIGKSDYQSDMITQSLVDRYRAVIGSDDMGGNIPYGLHWCTCLPKAPMTELAQDGHPKTGGFLPASQLPRRMWASSKINFLRPIRIGAKIDRHSKIKSVTAKQGRSGPLLFVEVEHIIEADREESIGETQTIVYRDVSTSKAKLPIAKAFSLDDWSETKKVIPTPALLFRYSALTFNTHRIHYDQVYASDVEGYPALVVHGPLMASLLLNFATELADSTSITHFQFRGLSPAYCNQELTLVANTKSDEIDLAIMGLDGTKIMAAKAAVKV